MNFVGHIATGLRAGDGNGDAAFLVGTALPDFAAMGRFRLHHAPADGALGRGIALHHATDHAFHADPWFLALEASLRAALARDGLPDGAARACAHVGPELLLDGSLLDDGAVTEAVGAVYERIAAPPGDVVALAPDGTRARWRAHLEGVATRLDPHSYRDADVIARRLHAITSRRPRLAFDESLVGAVAEQMAAVQAPVGAAAPAVLDRVTRQVGKPRRRRHRS